MKNEQHRGARMRPHWLLAAVAVLALAACNDNKTASGSGGAVEGDARSKHFDAVNAHLDLGGMMYGYVDVDGDVEKIAEWGNRILAMALESSGGEVPLPLAKLDFGELLSDLGLDGIEAVGMSSYRDGELYRNKMYMHIPEGRRGLLKVTGGDAGAFAAKSLAPAGSDMVYEVEIDLASLFDLAVQMVSKHGGAEMAREMKRATSEPMGGLGMSAADIAKHLDTRLVMIARLHPDKPLELPEEIPVEIPGFDVLIALEGVGPIFEQIVESIPEDARQEVLKPGDGFTDMVFPVPPEMAGIIQPVVRHEASSGRVLFASSAAYLEECLSGKTTAWDDADFKAATKGLPETGNGLSYMSGTFAGEYQRVYSGIFDAMVEEGALAGLGEMVSELMAELGLKAGVAQAAVMTNLEGGILIDSRAGASMKAAAAGMGVGMLAGFGSAFWASAARPSSFESPVPEIIGEDHFRSIEEGESSTAPRIQPPPPTEVRRGSELPPVPQPQPDSVQAPQE